MLSRTCSFIGKHTPFHVGNSPKECEEHVQVISGEQEGLLGWIAINYLMDGFHFKDLSSSMTLSEGEAKGKEVAKAKQKSTFGFLDMGGASTQIAFEPSQKALASSQGQLAEDDLTSVHLRTLDGSDVSSDVFVTTFLGFGTNKARERYVDQLFLNSTSEHEQPIAPAGALSDPCLPTGLVLSASPSQAATDDSASSTSATSVVGTGSFGTCLASLKPLLQKEASCARPPCLFYGVHVPPIDFDVNHFIGVSEYWYSAHDVFGLGGVYDYVDFQQAAAKFCSRNWTSLKSEFEGGKYAENVDEGRLRMQCFKSAWMTTVLHEGIGIPRIIDSKGKGDGEDHADSAQDKADDKNLFQSVNDVNGLSVSWTLGKAVLEASRGIPSMQGELAGDVAGQVDALSPGPGNWRQHGWPWAHSSTTLKPQAYSLLFVFALAMFALSSMACFVIRRIRSPRAPYGVAGTLLRSATRSVSGGGGRRSKRGGYVRANGNDEMGAAETAEMLEGAAPVVGFSSNSDISSSDEDVSGSVRAAPASNGIVATLARAVLPNSWRLSLARSLMFTPEGRKKKRSLQRRRARQQQQRGGRHLAANPPPQQSQQHEMSMRMSRPASPATFATSIQGAALSRPSSRASSTRPSMPAFLTASSLPPSRAESPALTTQSASGTSSVVISRTNSSANVAGLNHAGSAGYNGSSSNVGSPGKLAASSTPTGGRRGGPGGGPTINPYEVTIAERYGKQA